jgi:nucleoside triphosphate pyrophosphatase
MRLILASSSPRRAEILRNAGFRFDVFPTNVDETRLPDEGAEDYVRRLAGEKARIAAQHAREGQDQAISIGADTVVVLGNQVLGKPQSVDQARWILGLLSGRTHQVFSGLALIAGGREISELEVTQVTFAELSRTEIESYLASGEPFDKAGAYGIQGIGGRFVRRIEGCYFNVMGMPLSRLWSALRILGWNGSETDGGIDT